MKKSVVTTLAAVLACAALAQAQPPAPDAPATLVQVPGSHTYSFHWNQDQGKTASLKKAWNSADGEDEREDVMVKTQDYLEKQFDADMKRREKELQRIEKRLAKLRQQLDRRMAKKDEIVELQLKQLTMSWDGLGWSDRMNNTISGQPCPRPPQPWPTHRLRRCGSG